MVKHFEEIHEKIKDVTGERVIIDTGTVRGIAEKITIETGTISNIRIRGTTQDVVFNQGTATLGDLSLLQSSTGTALSVDGYVVVTIGGTVGYVPVFVSKIA